MAKPNAAAVAEQLRELALRMELAGGNPYRAKAHNRAAENLLLSQVPIERLTEEGRLQDIPGIGEALAAVITEIYNTGRYRGLDALREKAPEGLLELLRLPGIKPDRIRKLHAELGISSLEGLERAAREGRLKAVKGFGPAFEAKVLQAIDMSRRPQGRHLHRAAAAIEYASSEIKRLHPDWTDVTPAGEFRRGCELISTLSLVVVDPRLQGASKTISQADQLAVHVTARDHYGVTLLLATGSEAHVDGLKTLAKKKGYKLDSRGLWKASRVVAALQKAGDVYCDPARRRKSTVLP